MLCLLIGIGTAGCYSDLPGPSDARPPDATFLPFPCDTVAQDCPAGWKCSIALNGTFGRRCVVQTGTVAEGEACTGARGVDDCDKGLLCDSVLRCSRLCVAEAPVCAVNENCAQYATTRDGLCKPICTLFDAASCPAGQTCDGAVLVGGDIGRQCRLIGPVPVGGNCQQDRCGADATCGTPFGPICGALCDDDHPCALGSCVRFPLEPTVGTCN